jgi:hypothetical protein
MKKFSGRSFPPLFVRPPRSWMIPPTLCMPPLYRYRVWPYAHSTCPGDSPWLALSPGGIGCSLGKAPALARSSKS